MSHTYQKRRWACRDHRGVNKTHLQLVQCCLSIGIFGLIPPRLTRWWFRLVFYFQIPSPRLVRPGPSLFAGPIRDEILQPIVIMGLFHKPSYRSRHGSSQISWFDISQGCIKIWKATNETTSNNHRPNASLWGEAVWETFGANLWMLCCLGFLEW